MFHPHIFLKQNRIIWLSTEQSIPITAGETYYYRRCRTSCALNTVKSLGKQGFNITILPVDQHGMVNVTDVEEAITDKTIPISIIHSTNEVGTITFVAGGSG
ncbi:MAG: aminotransferase class V-fold PLP-dependent enzyme [Desulfotomaculaceae bacterium]|nr:aminotransferase class V-fold PLP-dependent enzyme [Desulfotomaculaceae bacterium]